MKGLIAFGVLVAVLAIGLGVWTATPLGGGGLFSQGEAGQDVTDEAQGESRGVVPQERSTEREGVVLIESRGFTPTRIEVPANSVVTFRNTSDAARGVVFEDDRLQDAREVPTGGAHAIEVPASGTFSFESPDDPELGGTIVVQAE